uniref:ATP synthase mitochondrial F1 complex assembly factor 2 n=1 Tax=Macrostomum lignano TaxID=282301 RepID=A0A1I8FQT5_9PLAT
MPVSSASPTSRFPLLPPPAGAAAHPGNLAQLQPRASWRRGLPVRVVSGAATALSTSLRCVASAHLQPAVRQLPAKHRYEDFQRALPLPEVQQARRPAQPGHQAAGLLLFSPTSAENVQRLRHGPLRRHRHHKTSPLDIADPAVNLLVYVGVPEDAVERSKGAVYAALERAKVDPQVLLTRRSDPPVPAPRADRAGRAAGPGQRDPIHDQLAYLSSSLLEQLREEHGVRPFTICAVRNLHSCIKVATDFVSPGEHQNIRQCLQLTREFRQLSSAHSNHEDKLQ